MPNKFEGVTRSEVQNIRHDNTSVIIRMATDPAHPDYDPRVDLPVDLELMESIKMVGQLEPASGYLENNVDGPPTIHLVFGRQRWKAVQAIWNKMREAGENMDLAPAFKVALQRPEDTTRRRQKRIIENRHRQGLEGLALAREVADHLAIVGEDEHSMETTRILFNFKSRAALENCLALLDTTEKVQAKIVDGTLSPTAALQLSRQPAQVQDAVVNRIESETEEDRDFGFEVETCEDSLQTDVFDPAPAAPAPEPPAKSAKSVSVSGIKEMIREETGKQSFALVTLKQIEKQIERKENDLEKALTKLETCPTSVYDQGYQKTINQAGKVAEIQGEIKALRWCRGESIATGSDVAPAGNDKMSAAWDALREALTSAAWPKVIERDDLVWKEVPRWDPDDAEIQKQYDEADAHNAENRAAIDASHLLVIAGEKVAYRRVYVGRTFELRVDTGSKWFTRLMDPFGKPSQLVRDWGAHGYLESHGKAATVPAYKTLCSHLCEGRTAIQIKGGEFLSKWLDGTPLEAPKGNATEASLDQASASDLEDAADA